MDILCATCREPWDTYHLRNDAIFETDLSHDEATAWLRLPPQRQYAQRYRAAFKAAGYEFDSSIINLLRCPCCRPAARPDTVHLAQRSVLDSLLRDDEDGLAAALEDLGERV